MDSIDIKILNLIQEHGRLSHSELREKIGLSIPAITSRVKKLEQQGIITGYTACVDARKLKKTITAFINVEINDPDVYDEFKQHIIRLEDVQECHHVVGKFDYLIKVKTQDTSTLETFITHHLRAIQGVGRTQTTIVLSTLKESSMIHLNEEEGI
jgi:Lrp/AsnC family leucine-responsive transcriptional regulator